MGEDDRRGMKDVVRLKTLETLRLNNTQLTDAELKEIGGLPNLRTLDSINTKVSGEGFEGAGLERLRAMRVTDALLTAKGRESPRKALPACKISE